MFVTHSCMTFGCEGNVSRSRGMDAYENWSGRWDNSAKNSPLVRSLCSGDSSVLCCFEKPQGFNHPLGAWFPRCWQ
ncbi:hypothetical protein CEXT_568341 [Caerostris extrusa]|uniref:Uncharacterized protein n=1 Tax=Caerostris extrusa TaxID=172846 RepID=A0AAV4XW40_CAEEX|nr:hypothetical protein CEXT_568341 [Caerostris extrusa]